MDTVTYQMTQVQHKAIDLAALSNSGCDHETLWRAIKEFRRATSDFELAARAKRLETVTS